MIQVLSKTLTLEEFRKGPERKPASEYIDGNIIQKPMAKSRHSRLQSKLLNAVNEVTEEKHSDGYWIQTIDRFSSGAVKNSCKFDILRNPVSWRNRVSGPLRSPLYQRVLTTPILVFQPKQQPELHQGTDNLVILEEIDLILTVEQVFAWRKMN